MRESARPENLEWARKIASRFVREFPAHRGDVESEAYMGLVKAEGHPDCPGAEEYQAFAYPFVRGAITDYTRILRRQARHMAPMHSATMLGLEHVPDPRVATAPWEWDDFRREIAGHLGGARRRVFLLVYGDACHQTLNATASDTGLSLDQVKRHHVALMETLRDLPCIRRVA